MLKRKAELGASIAAHAQFEAELKERMAAFAKKEKEQMERDCERLRDDRRKDIYLTDERIQAGPAKIPTMCQIAITRLLLLPISS